MTQSTVVIGDSRNMAEIKDGSIQLIVTSPPYFNVKDYGTENIGSINEYEAYLRAMYRIFGGYHFESCNSKKSPSDRSALALGGDEKEKCCLLKDGKKLG